MIPSPTVPQTEDHAEESAAVPAAATQAVLAPHWRALAWCRQRSRPWRGAMLALVVSLLLHAALLSTAGRQVRVGDASGELPHTITAELRRATPAPGQAPVSTSTTPRPSRPRVVPATPPAELAAGSEHALVAAPVDALPTAPSSTAPATAPPTTAPAAPPATDPAQTRPAVEAPAPDASAGQVASTALSFSHWPPSGTLSYKAVHSVHGYEDRKTFGVGDIRWQRGADDYRIEQDIALDLFVTSIRILTVVSQGRIGASGLEPVRYTEQVRSKAPLATNFNRDLSDPTVSFSASTSTYHLPPDAQDRASVIFQLAAVVRNSPTAYKPGDMIQIPLAGVRVLEPWNFKVGEMEWLETGLGRVQALYLVREPHPESNDKKVELWFAPDYEWLPVHIVYTEKNGDSIDMTARGWKAAP
jgi:hypothetical protein